MTPSRTVAICGRWVGVDDRGDDVPPESGTDLIEQIGVGGTAFGIGMVPDFQAWYSRRSDRCAGPS